MEPCPRHLRALRGISGMIIDPTHRQDHAEDRPVGRYLQIEVDQAVNEDREDRSGRAERNALAPDRLAGLLAAAQPEKRAHRCHEPPHHERPETQRDRNSPIRSGLEVVVVRVRPPAGGRQVLGRFEAPTEHPGSDAKRVRPD